MPWSAGTYARLYGSAGWVDDRDAGTKILATRHDSHDQDLADGINACLKKDGTNAATADLNAGGFKITNLGTPTATTDAATKAYVDAAGSVAFASGDQIIFRGAATPTGWTVAAQNNKALRVVSGTPGSGGSASFSSVFGAGKGTGSEASHFHGPGTLQSETFNIYEIGGVGAGSSTLSTFDDANSWAGLKTGAAVLQITGGTTAVGSAHSHTLSLDLQYYDMQVIQKT